MSDEIKLGDHVRDVVTGFKGMAVARCEYLFGNSEIRIEPMVLDDGKCIDAIWFAESRVVADK